jgi:hypothetical protein
MLLALKADEKTVETAISTQFSHAFALKSLIGASTFFHPDESYEVEAPDSGLCFVQSRTNRSRDDLYA